MRATRNTSNNTATSQFNYTVNYSYLLTVVYLLGVVQINWMNKLDDVTVRFLLCAFFMCSVLKIIYVID